MDKNLSSLAPLQSVYKEYYVYVSDDDDSRLPPGDVLQHTSDPGEEPSLLLLSVSETQSAPKPNRRDEEVSLRQRQRGVLQGGRRRRYELGHRLVTLVCPAASVFICF